MSELVIAEAREAWSRICRRGQTSFDDWVAIGKACAIGRAESLQKANTNKPYGKIYNRHMTAWLADTGLSEVQSQERYWALQIVDNLDAITTWRETLSDQDRRRLNHPQSIWVHWRKSQNLPTQKRCFVRTDTPLGRKGRPVFFDQDAVRRGAVAMKESRSADWFRLSRICLEAALPTRDHLMAILADEPRRDAAGVAELAHA